MRALNLLFRPNAYFAAMPREGGFLRPALVIAGWSLAGAVIALVWEVLGLGPFAAYGGVPAAAWGLLLGPAMGVAASFVGAALLHVMCKLLGGKAGFQATYRIVAAMAVMSPISYLLGPLPFSFILVQALLLFWTVAAAVQVHGTRKGPTWALIGMMTAFGLAGGWWAHKAAMRPLEHPGSRIAMPDEGSLTPEQRQALEDQAELHPVGSGDPKKP